MALVNLPAPWDFGIAYKHDYLISSGSMAINTRNASVFNPVKDGNIDKIVFRTGNTNTGTVTWTCRLETASIVSNSFMRPSGTLFHANGVSAAPITTTGSYQCAQFTLNGNVPVTKNDLVAIVITQTASGTGSISNFTPQWGQNYFDGNPVPSFWNGTAWSLGNGTYTGLFPGYSDGTYPFLAPFGQRIAADPLISVRQGNRFKFPFACRIGGMWANAAQPSSAWTIKAKLYNDSTLPSGSPASESRLWGRSESRATNPVAYLHEAMQKFMFINPVTIPANTWFKLVLEYEVIATGNSMATLSLGTTNLNVPTSAMSLLGFGDNVSSVVDTSNAWVENTSKIYQLGPIISAVDDGSGGIRLPMAMNGGYSA